jgi:UDP-glucose 4-epimerase
MKIIITGAAGFVGSNLFNKMVELGYDVEGIDNLSFGFKENVKAGKLWTADFSKMPVDFWEKYDVLVHLATANIIFAMNNEVKTFETNSLNTIDLFKKFGKKKIVYTSTTSIYGNADYYPTNEYAPHKCYNAYDTSKYIAELCLQQYNYTTLRLSNVYGPNQRPQSAFSGVIGKMIGKALAGETIEIFGDGKSTRDYTYVDDVVQAIIMAIEQEPKKMAINIASGKETSANDLAKHILVLLGKEYEHEITKNVKYLEPRKIDFITRRCLQVECANYVLGWQPKTNLLDGLKKTIADFKVQMSL